MVGMRKLKHQDRNQETVSTVTSDTKANAAVTEESQSQ